MAEKKAPLAEQIKKEMEKEANFLLHILLKHQRGGSSKFFAIDMRAAYCPQSCLETSPPVQPHKCSLLRLLSGRPSICVWHQGRPDASEHAQAQH